MGFDQRRENLMDLGDSAIEARQPRPNRDGKLIVAPPGFRLEEDQRVADGSALLADLTLPPKIHNPLEEFGVLTVEGANIVVYSKMKPRQFGKRSKEILTRRLAVYYGLQNSGT